MNATASDRGLTRNDVVALWFFLVVGAALVVMTTVFAVVRVVDAFTATTIRVPAEFTGTLAEAPVGPDGAARAVELDSALLIADGMSVAGRSAIVIEQHARKILELTDDAIVLERGRVVLAERSATLIAEPERLEHHLGLAAAA